MKVKTKTGRDRNGNLAVYACIVVFLASCSQSRTPEKTMTSTFLYPTATRTQLLSPTTTPLPTPLPSATIAMAEYYLPHPALVRVAPNDYFPLFNPEVWIDDTHAVFEKLSEAEVWDEYLIPRDSSGVQYLGTKQVVSNHSHECADSVMTASFYHIPGDAYYCIESFDSSKVLILMRTEKPVASMRLGMQNIPPIAGRYFEGWIVDNVGQKAQAFFYTPEDFVYYWEDNHRYITATGACYGMELNPGRGTFIIDTEAFIIINGLKDVSGGVCEGEVGLSFSPGMRYVIFEKDHGTVETIQGTQRAHVCTSSEFARSYGWSPDGRYVFVACGLGDQPDVLRRYDTKTGNIAALTDRVILRFKAIHLVVSPGGSRILFDWGTNNFHNVEPYGIWLLDLSKLGN